MLILQGFNIESVFAMRANHGVRALYFLQPQNAFAFGAFSENVSFSEFPPVLQNSEAFFKTVFKSEPFFVFGSSFLDVF